VEYQVQLVNHSDHPVRIIGGTSDCSCVATADLPVTLSSKDSQWISIRVKLSSQPGFFNRQVVFWTDNDRARVIAVMITGKVEPLEEGASGG
jgi:hypothetical protein